MNKLAQIEHFLAVVDAGGFSAAALKQGIAPSAPIRAVAALEQRLQVQLFRRTTRRITVTEEGSVYAARCRAILADLQEADRHTSESASQLSGLIRVTAPVMMGHQHVAPLLTQFLGEHPLLTLDFQLSDHVVDLVVQSFDLGIRIGHLNNSSMIAQQVAQVHRVVCASPKYLQSNGTPRTPSDLANHRCVHFDGYAPHNEWIFELDGKTISARPLTIMTTSHLDAAIQACVAGVGCGVFLSYQVEDQLRAKSLKRVLEQYAKPELPVSLVMPPGRLASARIKTLKNWIAPRLRRRLLGGKR